MGVPGANGYTHSLCILDIAKNDTFDHRLAHATIDSLELASTRWDEGKGQPFAIFAGFRRPHVPWRLPRHWWDLYENRTVAPPLQTSVYTDAPQIGFTCGDQCNWTLWDPDGANTSAGQKDAPVQHYNRTTPLTDPFAAMNRRAYYAAITLMDDAVGEVLGTVDRLGLRESTLVIFHADHGAFIILREFSRASTVRILSFTLCSHLLLRHGSVPFVILLRMLQAGAWVKGTFGTSLQITNTVCESP